MLIAILSDIHGNLEAFQAVIKDMEARNPATVICLGDLIGYGPDPDEIVKIVIQKNYRCVLGNHEAALMERKMRNSLNFQAKDNSIHTEKLLSPASLEFCCSLKKTLKFENSLYVHGFPPESVLRYASKVSDKELISFFTTFTQDLCFVGHTHDLFIIRWDGKRVTRETFAERIYSLNAGNKYLINAGSVGQPRDGNNNSKYLLWDSDNSTLEVVFVPYDFKTTAQKIKERGFPDAYGLRLR